MTAKIKIPFDLNTINNVLDSTVEVEVRVLGDVNGDGTVNMRDIAAIVFNFNQHE